MDIKHMAYEKYRLNWMIQHGYTLQQLITTLTEIQDEDLSVSVNDCFEEFDLNIGFNGCIWVSYSEFLDNEYQDKNYMKSLLSESEYEEYMKGEF